MLSSSRISGSGSGSGIMEEKCSDQVPDAYNVLLLVESFGKRCGLSMAGTLGVEHSFYGSSTSQWRQCMQQQVFAMDTDLCYIADSA